MNPTVTLNAFLVLLVLGLWTPVTAHAQTVFLERGQREVIPCPLIKPHQIPSEDLSSIYVYWYFRQIDPLSLLISYFYGAVKPQNGIPEGVYDIDRDFSLVVDNVTDLDAGTYFCKVKLKNEVPQSSNVSVAVKVSPRAPFPEIIDCDPPIPSNPSECQAFIPYDSRLSSLTCVVRNAKPAVVINWFRLFGEYRQSLGSTQTQTVVDTVLPPNSQDAGWFLINNTFTTSATIKVSPFADSARYRCEAYGSALGDRNGSHIIANIVVQGPPTHGTTTTGTSPIEETMASTTEVPYVPPVVAAVVGPIVSFGMIVMFVIVFLKVRKRRRGNTRVESENAEETLPLTEHINRQGLSGVLKHLFKAKMQHISIDPSGDNEAGAMHTDEIFIELELHERNNTVTLIKSREHMIRLLMGPQDRRHFIVKGEAGCGKTTLVRRFGYDWAIESDYMQPFDLVFVLKMKNMTDNPGILSAIISQNIPVDKAISKAQLKSVIDEVAENVLIILDGWDEMSSEVLNKQAPAGDYSVRDILTVNAFTTSCVIVTARPHMMKKLNDLDEDCVFTVIETTGFSTQKRNGYIRQRFTKDPDKADGLIQEIETAAFLEILAKVPIMLSLLCFIWNNKGKEKVLPARITELYGRVIGTLVKHWKNKHRRSLKAMGKRWLNKVMKALGKVSFKGLMDYEKGMLVFPRELFREEYLKDALALGFFSERPGSDEPTVTFTHKTFQEYFASYYLVRQTKWFIKHKFLSKVTIDTIQEVEYLLRFSCGMNKEVASVIFEHVRGIKDELISDRYLWVQHLTLMLYYEAQSKSLKAGVGCRLALKYKEEFAALQYYVDNIHDLDGGPRVHLERLEVYLHVIRDQTKVKTILDNVDVDSLYCGLLWSDSLGEELIQLNKTISELPYKPAQTVVCIDQKDQQDSERRAAAANNQEERFVKLAEFCSTKRFVCGFGLRIECNVITSPGTLVSLATGLGESQAVYFGVLNNNLNGYMSSLRPLIPSLQYLELYDCSLGHEDLMSLSELMPNAVHLREIYISGATFTADAVQFLVSKLKECPRMLMLELHNTGLLPQTIQDIVGNCFPEMTPVEGNVEGQFWLYMQK